MKQKLDHVPKCVTTFTIANSQEFFEIQIPRSTDNNGSMASSGNINEASTHDASVSIHECVGSRHHQKKTIPNNCQQKGVSVLLQQPQRGEHPIARSMKTYEDLLSGPIGRSSLPAASQDNDDDIHLVMIHEERYSVYCINVEHKRIDILDFF